MGSPGRSWGNAVSWAGNIGGGNHTPAVGAIAWWGAEVAAGYGHVAYVEQVSRGNVYIRADNYSTSRGYTNAGWVAASSVDLFLHPHDTVPPTLRRSDFNGDGRADIAWYEAWNNNSISILLSNGANGFTIGRRQAGIGKPDWAATGDFNGDGRADIAWYEAWNNNSISILLSNGANGFTIGRWQAGIGKPDWAASTM
jgi:FG-GAP-like repeat/CHAP domain